MSTFGVPASAGGHLYQLRYALLLLLRSVRALGPATELSIERTDDIAIDVDGELVSAIQTKQRGATASGTPVSLTDASADLWKTLRVWCEGFEEGTIRIPGTALYLVSTAVASESSAAALLRPACRGVAGAHAKLRAVAATSRSKDNAVAYAAWNRLSDGEQRALLEQVQVLDGAPDMLDLGSLLERELVTNVPPRLIPVLLQRLEGWWLQRVVAHLKADKKDRISGLELTGQMHDIQSRLEDDALPIDDDLLGAAEPKLEDNEQRLFVRQLQLVGLSNPGLLAAVRDYYRAYAQRSRWAGDDLLYVSELERYERRLVDEWGHVFALMQSQCPEDEGGRAAAGLQLYRELTTRPFPIRRDCNEGFIARGSFHMLADAPREAPRIGWHVDFLERLRALLVGAA
jgi:hypothetical protein